jgi:hypothetical protein
LGCARLLALQHGIAAGVGMGDAPHVAGLHWPNGECTAVQGHGEAEVRIGPDHNGTMAVCLIVTDLGGQLAGRIISQRMDAHRLSVRRVRRILDGALIPADRDLADPAAGRTNVLQHSRKEKVAVQPSEKQIGLCLKMSEIRKRHVPTSSLLLITACYETKSQICITTSRAPIAFRVFRRAGASFSVSFRRPKAINISTWWGRFRVWHS